MKTLAVIASRGEFNSLVQVGTLLIASVAFGLAVRVFFPRRGHLQNHAHRRLRDNLSPAHQRRVAGIRERLAEQGLNDLSELLRQIVGVGIDGYP